jgi:hypothetical protein
MATKTTFSIKVSFENEVVLSHVASSKLQNEQGGQATKKTLGVTKPRVSVTRTVLHWDETTDPIANKLTLAIKEVTAEVVYSARIWIDDAIDKKCDCYKHVLDHEKQHVKIWKDGAKKYAEFIIQAVADVTSPQMDMPEEIELSKAPAFRDAAFQRIDAAVNEAAQNCGKKISAESKKIHTSAELKKTNSLCADYLID